MAEHFFYKNFWTDSEKVKEFFEIKSSERLTLLPNLADIVGEFKPSKLLDFGCGDGFIHHLLDADISKALFDINEDVLKKTADSLRHKNCYAIKDKNMIPYGEFDVVILSLVLICIGTIEEQSKILDCLRQSLKVNGRLVFVGPHPCFRQFNFRPFHTEFLNQEFAYMNEGTPFTVLMHEGESEAKKITDFHFTISTIVKLFKANGFNLERVIELPDKDLHDGKDWNKQYPPFLILIYNLKN